MFSAPHVPTSSRPRHRLLSRHAAVAVAAVAIVVGLGACSTGAASSKPLTGISACALGKTWKLDTAALGTSVQDILVKQGVAGATVKADGNQSMTWDVDGRVTLDSNYTLTVTSAPAAGQSLVVTDKHTGIATGISYINAEVAIPRKWDATAAKRTSTATLNGAAVDPVPYALVSTDLDDTVGVELTCDGGTLTTHQRGTALTLKWAS